MEVITNVQFDEVISKGVVVIDFFKDGQAVDQISGFVGKNVILEKLNPLL